MRFRVKGLKVGVRIWGRVRFASPRAFLGLGLRIQRLGADGWFAGRVFLTRTTATPTAYGQDLGFGLRLRVAGLKVGFRAEIFKTTPLPVHPPTDRVLS